MTVQPHVCASGAIGFRPTRGNSLRIVRLLVALSKPRYSLTQVCAVRDR